MLSAVINRIEVCICIKTWFSSSSESSVGADVMFLTPRGYEFFGDCCPAYELRFSASSYRSVLSVTGLLLKKSFVVAYKKKKTDDVRSSARTNRLYRTSESGP